MAIALPLLWLRAHAAAQQELDAQFQAMSWFGKSMTSKGGQARRGEQGPKLDKAKHGKAPLGEPNPHGRPLERRARPPHVRAPRQGPRPGHMTPAPPIDLNPDGQRTRYHIYSLDLLPVWPHHAELPKELVGQLTNEPGPVRRTGRRVVEGEPEPAYAYYLAERQVDSDGTATWLVVESYRRTKVDRTSAHLRQVLPDVGLVLLAALLALSPLITRIRRLTDAVSRAGSQEALDIDMAGRDEISSLARAFERTRRAAQQHLATAEKREAALRTFVDNTTHDVAVPLSTLQGHLSALAGPPAPGNPNEQTQETLAAAQRDAEYVASLLGNLASAARLEASEEALRFAILDLGVLVGRVGLRHRSFGATQGVSVDWGVPEEPVVVSGDTTLLEQALGNLVQNAVRHGASGGHVALTFNQALDRFELVVLDDGPGVAEDALEFLDKRHYRGDEARGRHPSGRGLGLAITQDILERHGFTWTFGNRPEGGFVATITGPLLGACCT